MPLPNIGMQERQQLALDLLQHCNVFPTMWEGRHAWVIGQLLHTITDPRETQPLKLSKGTRLIAAIKKDSVLWGRVKSFVEAYSWNKKCKCGHGESYHSGILGCCTGRKRRYDSSSPQCKCNHYEERGL